MSWIRSILLLLGLAGLASSAGCVVNPTPAEAVLAGTWQLVPSATLNPPLTSWFLTFDGNGDVTNVTYTFAGFAAVIWTNPPSATNVEGGNVYISATEDGSTLTFTGTMNASNTAIAGTLNAIVSVGGATVSVNQSPAVLTKL